MAVLYHGSSTGRRWYLDLAGSCIQRSCQDGQMDSFSMTRRASSPQKSFPYKRPPPGLWLGKLTNLLNEVGIVVKYHRS